MSEKDLYIGGTLIKESASFVACVYVFHQHIIGRCRQNLCFGYLFLVSRQNLRFGYLFLVCRQNLCFGCLFWFAAKTFVLATYSWFAAKTFVSTNLFLVYNQYCKPRIDWMICGLL